jgi:DNA-binding NarL/FixJ family response regulator
MHKDDNPANCCYRNLKWGASQLDNIADRQAKGRQSKGARQAAAKLTDRKVLAIRKLLSSGVSQRVIARKFQISAPVVSRINTGQAWAHVQGDA